MDSTSEEVEPLRERRVDGLVSSVSLGLYDCSAGDSVCSFLAWGGREGGRECCQEGVLSTDGENDINSS